MHAAVAIVTVTGLAFAWIKYGMSTDDPFAVVNHAWQPTILHLHILAAPVLVFAIGWIFSDHISAKYRSGAAARRPTGILAMWVIAPMIVSGYLLQVFTGERALQVSAVAHWVTSAAFVVAYVVHQLSRRR